MNVSLPLTDTNRAVSIVFYDTIAPNTLGAGKSFAFTMPDTADANSAIFVFVPAVFGKGITTAKSATLFYYQTPDGKVTGSKYNSPSGAITGNSRIWTTKVGGLSASGTTINIVDSVFGGGSNRTPIKGATFTAIPGGIYEIVSHGDPNVPATLATTVVLVNSNKP